MKYEKLGVSLYRRGETILARVRVNGRLTWRSTGTNEPKDARQWLKKWKQESWMLKNGFEPKGVVLQRKRVTVGEIVQAYLDAGCPNRAMQRKAPYTVQNEKYFLNPVRDYFQDRPAAALTVHDCDKYLEWRISGGYVSKLIPGGKTKGGNRAVDLELTILCNAFALAVRRNVLTTNPLEKRSKYTVSEDVRHCREVAPSPEGLQKIIAWLRAGGEATTADLVCFLAYSGVRIGEALPLTWSAVRWQEGFIHVKREKKGITPWIPLGSELVDLLTGMPRQSEDTLLFPSPFNPGVAMDVSAIRRRIRKACNATKIGLVTPHGFRSYFVTQAREAGLTDAEIAALIGDKTGPAIIAHTYGAVRPEHLLAQAKKISHKSSHTLPAVSHGCSTSPEGATIICLPMVAGD